MSWKDWPYWLKGGIITLILSISIIPIIFYEAAEDLFLWLRIIIIIPFTLIKIIFSLNMVCYLLCTPETWFHWGILFLFWFLVGALIGWLYGKFKDKKSTKSNQEN